LFAFAPAPFATREMSPAMQRFCFAALSTAGMLRAAVPTLDARVRNGECMQEYDDGYVFLDNQRIANLPSLAMEQLEGQVISAAWLVTVKYVKNYKVLTDHMAKEQYVLTQCGTSPPTPEALDVVDALATGYVRKHFTIPIQSAIAASTAQLGFVDVLGVQDRFTHVDEYATGSCWQKALSCGAKFESQWGGNVTLRSQQINGADVVFMDCTSTGPVDCSNVNGQGNAVHLAATQDAGNLRGAEYVKFLAAFFNKEKEANAAFASASRKYAEAATGRVTKPTVAWIQYSAYGRAYLELSQATYKLQFTADAGAINKNATAVNIQLGNVMEVVSGGWGSSFRLYLDGYNGSLSNASAVFFGALGDVDVVVDETYAFDPSSYDVSSFLSNYALSANSVLKFVQGKMVLRIDGTLSENNGIDWYESRVAHPDWAVDGLARALYKDASMPFKYFRNIAEGESPQVLKADACTKNLPVCKATQSPAPIPATLAPDAVLTSGAALMSAVFHSTSFVAMAAIAAC